MQIFSPSAVIALKLGAGAVTVAVAAGLFAWRTYVAPRPSVGSPVEQIVPFSHKHHAGDDGIDCRYCHVSVETSAFAGIPSLATCMTCHSQLFSDAPMLRAVRESFAGARPFAWKRIHDLPDFVYFDHSIHITKGIGCSTCHGEVDRMPLTWRVASLHMQWCLACHREPERYLRSQDQVFDMRWSPPADQASRGKQLREAYHLHSTEVLTSCSTCHR
jgi:hypothetical protein